MQTAGGAGEPVQAVDRRGLALLAAPEEGDRLAALRRLEAGLRAIGLDLAPLGGGAELGDLGVLGDRGGGRLGVGLNGRRGGLPGVRGEREGLDPRPVRRPLVDVSAGVAVSMGCMVGASFRRRRRALVVLF